MTALRERPATDLLARTHDRQTHARVYVRTHTRVKDADKTYRQENECADTHVIQPVMQMHKRQDNVIKLNPHLANK